MIKGMTIKDATYRWVNGFNQYPLSMIQLLMDTNPDDWREVTMPTCGDKVYVLSLGERGKVAEDFSNDKYRVNIYGSNNSIVVDREDLEIECETGFPELPKCGKLWSFGESLDDDWLEDKGGLKKMSELGFRLYRHVEWGYFFGIDNAGCDFFANYWIPLYKARGIEWHDTTLKEDK